MWCKNYGPISIINIIPKLLDAILARRLYDMCESKISIHQHGSVKGKTTEKNLLRYSNYLSSITHKGGQADTIYLDFSKAFDMVNPSLLILRISKFGVPQI